jgi:hypothetical protein
MFLMFPPPTYRPLCVEFGYCYCPQQNRQIIGEKTNCPLHKMLPNSSVSFSFDKTLSHVVRIWQHSIKTTFCLSLYNLCVRPALLTHGGGGGARYFYVAWPAKFRETKFRETFREIFISHFVKFLNYFREISRNFAKRNLRKFRESDFTKLYRNEVCLLFKA